MRRLCSPCHGISQARSRAAHAPPPRCDARGASARATAARAAVPYRAKAQASHLAPLILAQRGRYKPRSAASKLTPSLHAPQLPYCRAPLPRREGGIKYCFRYRLCETHLRAPVVDFGGLPSRWCQKCSRFHQLPAFAVRGATGARCARVGPGR